MRLIGRIFSFILILLGLYAFFEALGQPAIIANSYLTASIAIIVAGIFGLYLFRNKKKYIEKKAQEAADIEKRKDEILRK